jgi:hypothetical protein
MKNVVVVAASQYVLFLKLCLGINGIFYYAVTFFTEAGIEETKAKAGL